MTKRKKRALEQARLQEEQRKAYDSRPRVMYGPVNGDDSTLPVINSSVRGVQLPPIIQPISLLPYLSDLNFNIMGNPGPGSVDEFVDDFDDDFDDMF